MDGKWGWRKAPLILLLVLATWWRWIVAIGLAAAVVFIVGCSSLPPEVIEVPVPFEVPCTQEEPDRPALSIDGLPQGLPPDEQARNLRADHDLRDGYETRLRAALRACKSLGSPADEAGL